MPFTSRPMLLLSRETVAATSCRLSGTTSLRSEYRGGSPGLAPPGGWPSLARLTIPEYSYVFY